jgi:hypothetical protein
MALLLLVGLGDKIVGLVCPQLEEIRHVLRGVIKS